MLRLALAASLALIASPILPAMACGGYADLTPILDRLVSADPAASERAVASLRAYGPAGLKSLLARYDQSRDPKLIPSIDAVAAQHDAVWSRLYWYTDLDTAKSVAAAQHKPILYLRMLGKLTDEYSCANSRFFRTVLYANPAVADLLRERFILVWQSERPVPVVTIDYGDGRVLKRTLTGNSIHYVLTPDGEVVDALPGLFDPVTFQSTLRDVADVAVTGTPERRSVHLIQACSHLLSDFQRESAALASAVPTALTPDSLATKAMMTSASKRELESSVLSSVTPKPVPTPARQAMAQARTKTLVEGPIVTATAPADPNAAEAAGRAFSKLSVERPLVRAISAPPQPPQPPAAAVPAWSQLAVGHIADARLDPNSIALIRSHNPALDADPALLERTISNFERSIAEDTVRNNFDFRVRILTWMIEADAPIALEDLNRRVYSELFLTPRTDPWLGLVPEATYSALTNDGCSLSNSK